MCRLLKFSGFLVLLIAAAAGSRVMAAESLRIVTLGDSITKGVRSGVAAEQTFAALIEAELKKAGQAIEVVNVGIGGERTDGALARLQRDVVLKKPRIVTIMYGTNDSYVDKGRTASRLTIEQYRENLVKLVEQLQDAGIQPVLMTEPRWGDKASKNGVGEHPNERLEKYVAACRAVAREKKVPLVDHFAHWSAAASKGVDIGAWTTDQCHPNPEGNRILADEILRVLRAEKLVSGVQ